MGKRNSRKGTVYNKLVRDRIPEIVQNAGKTPRWRNIGDDDLKNAVGLKILEEAHEFFTSWQEKDRGEVLKEAADLLEISLKALELKGYGIDDLLNAREDRRSQRGGFEGDILLESVDASPDVESVEQTPRFFFIPVHDKQLIRFIKSELNRSRAVSIASAFYSPAIVNLLVNDFIRFTEHQGRLRILLSTMGRINRPGHLEHLPQFVQDAEIRVFHPPEVPFDCDPPNFHAKAFIFEHEEGKGSLLIGSSNFTQGGFSSNVEWNYFSPGEVNLPFCHDTPFRQALKEFERIWKGFSVELTDEFLSSYRKRFAAREPSREDFTFQPQAGFEAKPKAPRSIIEPNGAQQEALEKLAALRENGAKSAAVIAATGVGKTYLAAFHYRQSGYRRVLFIVHRENIVRKARESFREVLGQPDFGAILGGGNHIEEFPDAVFAMIQTLSRDEHFKKFPRDFFDLIVVDEFHHAEAASYRKVLDHFRPAFLLGLTATPERMDGRDVLGLCDYNVAYEVRLFEAIDQGWLTPFQYYAVHDPTDYEKITWRGTGYVERELEEALADDTRTAILAHNVCKFLPASGKIKALAFCSSVAHARYTAIELSDKHGLEAMTLVGEHSEEERAGAIARLEDENDPLRILCCVDIFNEGVDIPSLTHILLLRPTQSFTVFLQQVGRGLRLAPDKDFVVVIDFVGNYRKAHVAPLALRGYTSVEEFAQDRIQAKKALSVQESLPQACFVDAETEVRRIWDKEIRNVLKGMSRADRLKALYAEIREELGDRSPQIMDLFSSAHDADPMAFIKEFGGWLRAKLACEGDLPEMERKLLDTPGEAFLKHLEMDLNPVKSYKMAVIKTLLSLGGHSWEVDEIARGFHRFYLDRREMLFDYDDLAKAKNPEEYPLSRVRSHLLRMPLHFLSNTDKDWFVLSPDKRVFSLKKEVKPYWAMDGFSDLLADRVDFALARYFLRRKLQQNVYFEPSILEWGFTVEPFFAENFFKTRLKSSEERSIKVEYGGEQYSALMGRHAMGKRYYVNYSDDQKLLSRIQKRFSSKTHPKGKVFVLARKNESSIELSDID